METRIKKLIELNQKHSDLYLGQRLERNLYLAKHPTKIVVFKCMDGRVHMPTVTHTPLGIMRPYRNIGGKFNLGWPLLNYSFDNIVTGVVSRGNRILVLVTYHYSAGDTHRGCAGFKYDCEESKRFTENFRKQIIRTYGRDNHVVCPILVGLETDRDALLFHGENGEVVNVADLADNSEENLKTIFHDIYPSMPDRVLTDLIPLVQGNMEHIDETQDKKPQTQLVHGEWILAVGKGFDWLHTPNMALIVGPYDSNVGEPIKTAASIIKSNMESGRIDKGFVVISSAVYYDVSEIARAKERSLYMNQLSREIIGKNYPEMLPMMNPLAVITNISTMKIEIVDTEI